MRKKKSVLGVIFGFLGVVFVLALAGLCIWTEVEHDKPVWTYIKDEIQENKDEKQQAEDEVVIEDENGETTAVIRF